MPDSAAPSSENVELLDALARGELHGDQRQRAEQLLEARADCRNYYARLTASRFPQIANYTIIDQVGKGGFGVVYKAVHHATERIEALKILFAKTPLLTSYFENEVHLIARLRHPNIATLYDAQLTTPPLFYTMDFVEGERLNDYLRTHEVSLAERVEFVRTVAQAIGYAHSQGVIHRDIKPQNILIDANRQPHIVDFGIARRLRLPEPVEPATEASEGREGPIGTLGYIAPEVVSGGRSDERVDVFALGALLFHCVTLEPARLAREPRHRDSLLRARRVSNLNDLSAIIACCVDPDPAQRYPSCNELVADLERYLAGREVRARRDRTIREHAGRIASLVVRNHPLGLRTAIIAAVTLGLATMLHSGMTTKHVGGFTVGKHASLVGITENCLKEMEDGELAKDLPPAIREDIFSWRPYHGRLMERLADAGPKVVVWDMAFQESDPSVDSYLVKGIEALQARNIPVVIGVATYDKNAEPNISPAILKAAHSSGTLAAGTGGGAGATIPTTPYEQEYLIVHAFQRGFEPPIPGLATATFAAARFPECRARVDFDQPNNRLEIRYRKLNPAASELRWEPDTDRLSVQDFHHVTADWKKQNVRSGVFDAGDVVAQASILAAPAKDWNEKRIEYSRIFHADTAQLRRWFAGQAVLIAQMRPGVDEKRNSAGETVYGCTVHAQAIESLLEGAVGGRYAWGDLGLRCLLWSVIAVVFVSVSPVRSWKSLRVPSLLTAAVCLGSLYLAAYASRGVTEAWTFQLLIAISAMLMAGALALLAKTARNWQMQRTPAALSWASGDTDLASTILADGSQSG